MKECIKGKTEQIETLTPAPFAYTLHLHILSFTELFSIYLTQKKASRNQSIDLKEDPSHMSICMTSCHRLVCYVSECISHSMILLT